MIWFDVDTALSEVPINLMPLLDDSDFKSKEESVAYNAAGLDLVWNFITTGGAFTQTAVTPTDTGGNYDWVNQGNGHYSIEIPASGGASINNDTEGFGWFTGVATGILPWRSPEFGFRAAGLNDKLIDTAYSATRGLSGTALPDAAADAAGGLPISDAGALDMDAIKTAADNIYADMAATADVADAVWDEAIADHTTAGSFSKAVTDILADTGTDGVVLTAAAVDAVLDEAVVGTYTMRQLLAVMASALAGKVSGGGTSTVTFRGINDASDVIVATVDANGNRSAVTLTV